MSNWLISTEWLARHLTAPDLAILDASWHLPVLNRNARAEFVNEHIPGAQFFDIDDLSDSASPYPHMLPSAEKFSSRMRKLGVGDGKKIVVYDSLGLYSAARAWWMFRVFGKDDVGVLDGGLKKWKAEGWPVETGEPRTPQERHFTARYQAMLVRDRNDITGVVKKGGEQLLDARSPGRFAGVEPEPRVGVRSGHVPGAVSVPYGLLINDNGTLKNPSQIQRIFKDRDIDPRRPTVSYCGSGVTAAILSLGLSVIGTGVYPVYDGSWAEWGALADLPSKREPTRDAITQTAAIR